MQITGKEFNEVHRANTYYRSPSPADVRFSTHLQYANQIMIYKLNEVDVDAIIIFDNDNKDSFIINGFHTYTKLKFYEDEASCKLAVQQYGNALQFVKDQTDEICKLAVQQNGNE